MAEITRKNVSTKDEIRLLYQHFPVASLTEGKLIQYSELEAILGISKNSYRWKNIISEWKKQLLLESKISLETKINYGYYVANNHERLTQAYKANEQGMKRLLKSTVLLDTVIDESLTQDELELKRKLAATNVAIGLASTWKRNEELPSI